MDERDLRMTLALIERHIKRWRKLGDEAQKMLDVAQMHQCRTAEGALDAVGQELLIQHGFVKDEEQNG
jgi:hypothetical protein